MTINKRSILDQLTVADPRDKKFTDEQLGTLGSAVNELLQVQSEILEQEDRLKQMKATERGISQGTIPQIMENLGFETITTLDGKKVSIKDSVQVSIPAADKPSAYKWMDDNGHGDLIKIALTAKFARGDRELADDCFNALVDEGASPNQTESVHSGTLKAWARVELEQGHMLPADLFKIHVVKLTTVK